MSTNLTFKTPASQSVIQRLLAHLAISADNIVGLSAAAGKSPSIIGLYLRHMASAGLIYRAKPATNNPFTKFSEPALWALAGVVVIAPGDSADECPRRVTVRKTWKPNHVRMAMECLLFGVPAAMQGVVA